jgi:predicted component of type VI protein secretion system
MAYIVVRVSGKELLRTKLTRPLVIGRAPEADLRIPDIRVSRKHCALEPVSDGWNVIDLTSKNGTWINGQQIQSHSLRDDETIEVGDARIAFHADEFMPARPEAPQDRLSDSTIWPPMDAVHDNAGTLAAVRVVVGKPKGMVSSAKRLQQDSTVAVPPLAFQRPPAAPRVGPSRASFEAPPPRQPALSTKAVATIVTIGLAVVVLILGWIIFAH